MPISSALRHILLPSHKLGVVERMTAVKQINLLRGWPNPALLPTAAIQTAAKTALSDPAVSTPGLLYGPDPGYQPLRESISSWLTRFYHNPSVDVEAAAGERICITGGASQNLACMLQVFTDPVYTRAWMVAPCYFLACQIFNDSGLKMTAVGEGEEGVDLQALEEGLEKCEREASVKVCVLDFKRDVSLNISVPRLRSFPLFL